LEAVAQRTLIDPKMLIKSLTVEDFCETAEAYFAGVANPEPLLAKPFHSLDEAPNLLRNLGVLLAGMNLGPSMTVLDFAAGSCWLSRFLAQMRCETISCDVSHSALELGKELFRKHPPINRPIAEPRFLCFDGHGIELPDESVDRIVCFDAFHHVANPREVLGELFRVLRPGGVAGFCEPGPQHSQTPEAQAEMANHNVLESDVVLAEIGRMAMSAGFTNLRTKVMTDLEINLKEHKELMEAGGGSALQTKVFSNAQALARNGGVFFLDKGPLVFDSRRSEGLAHELEVKQPELSLKAASPVHLELKARNIGHARWLAKTPSGIGQVRLGAHLYSETGKLCDYDFARSDLPRDIDPGESVRLGLDFSFPEPGHYRLVLDFVAEHIVWFEQRGSSPVVLAVAVA
jgi:ubiquinone/menaquinone biosynthesis C-methylase UbiE